MVIIFMDYLSRMIELTHSVNKLPNKLLHVEMHDYQYNTGLHSAYVKPFK